MDDIKRSLTGTTTKQHPSRLRRIAQKKDDAESFNSPARSAERHAKANDTLAGLSKTPIHSSGSAFFFALSLLSSFFFLIKWRALALTSPGAMQYATAAAYINKRGKSRTSKTFYGQQEERKVYAVRGRPAGQQEIPSKRGLSRVKKSILFSRP